MEELSLVSAQMTCSGSEHAKCKASGCDRNWIRGLSIQSLCDISSTRHVIPIDIILIVDGGSILIYLHRRHIWMLYFFGPSMNRAKIQKQVGTNPMASRSAIATTPPIDTMTTDTPYIIHFSRRSRVARSTSMSDLLGYSLGFRSTSDHRAFRARNSGVLS